MVRAPPTNSGCTFPPVAKAQKRSSVRSSLSYAEACMAADPLHPIDPAEHILRLGKESQESPRGQDLGATRGTGERAYSSDEKNSYFWLSTTFFRIAGRK